MRTETGMPQLVRSAVHSRKALARSALRAPRTWSNNATLDSAGSDNPRWVAPTLDPVWVPRKTGAPTKLCSAICPR